MKTTLYIGLLETTYNGVKNKLESVRGFEVDLIADDNIDGIVIPWKKLHRILPSRFVYEIAKECRKCPSDITESTKMTLNITAKIGKFIDDYINKFTSFVVISGYEKSSINVLRFNIESVIYDQENEDIVKIPSKYFDYCINLPESVRHLDTIEISSNKALGEVLQKWYEFYMCKASVESSIMTPIEIRNDKIFSQCKAYKSAIDIKPIKFKLYKLDDIISSCNNNDSTDNVESNNNASSKIDDANKEEY